MISWNKVLHSMQTITYIYYLEQWRSSTVARHCWLSLTAATENHLVLALWKPMKISFLMTSLFLQNQISDTIHNKTNVMRNQMESILILKQTLQRYIND